MYASNKVLISKKKKKKKKKKKSFPKYLNFFKCVENTQEIKS